MNKEVKGIIQEVLWRISYPVMILSMSDPVFGTTATFGGTNWPTIVD